MGFYLDTSVLVALFANDEFSPRATQFLARAPAPILVSPLGGAEFASAVARLVRERIWSAPQAQACFDDYDQWVGGTATIVPIEAADYRAATNHIRRLDLTLRAPDTIHIAITARLGASLATFDRKMATAASTLGVTVAPT